MTKICRASQIPLLFKTDMEEECSFKHSSMRGIKLVSQDTQRREERGDFCRGPSADDSHPLSLLSHTSCKHTWSVPWKFEFTHRLALTSLVFMVSSLTNSKRNPDFPLFLAVAPFAQEREKCGLCAAPGTRFVHICRPTGCRLHVLLPSPLGHRLPRDTARGQGTILIADSSQLTLPTF